jgi:AraC family transcriptional regulator of adaptative response/methylated-DNA-[protein]-cysteine methyltransferase
MSASRPAARSLRFTAVPSSLGMVLVARSAHGISAVLLGDDRAELEREVTRRFPEAIRSDDQETVELARRVAQVIESPASGGDLPLDLHGTDFQRAVWEALRAIPAGETATYAEIAERLGRPAAVRAVGQACGANNVAVLVPCHRVLRGDGSLSGYRWGVERKRALLERERA